VRSSSPAAEAIKVLARGHQNLIWTRTRQTNALRSALREYYPAEVVGLTDVLAAKLSTAFGCSRIRAEPIPRWWPDTRRCQT
jgi:hypothetical protein